MSENLQQLDYWMHVMEMREERTVADVMRKAAEEIRTLRAALEKANSPVGWDEKETTL